MSLMPLHAFEFIPRAFHGKTVCHFINNGNVGDQLIWAATAVIPMERPVGYSERLDLS